MNRKGIAVCIIAKNEGPYLKELISFYLALGFSSVIIFDNQSNDNTRMIVSNFKKRYDVKYHYILGHCRQKDVYNIALNKYSTKYKYIAFFDADEFLICNDFQIGSTFDFIDLLFRRVSSSGVKIGALAIDWIVFGTSGHINKPNGLVLENYSYCLPYDTKTHVKPIVDTRYCLYIRNPHIPFLFRRNLYCDSDGVIVKNSIRMLKQNKQIYLYHYYYKSIEEFSKKVRIGNVYNNSTDKEVEWAINCDKSCIKNNLDIRVLINSVKEVMDTI